MGIFDSIKGGAAQTPSANGSETFTFTALPESVEQLKALPEATLDTPFKAAALTVCALCAYAAAPEIGADMLNFLKGPKPLTGFEKQFLADRFRDSKLVPFSFLKGATPENEYTPSQPFTVTVSSNPYSFQNEGYATLWLKSGGADSERQITLRKTADGKWCLWEQMLLGGIKPTKSQNPWA